MQVADMVTMLKSKRFIRRDEYYNSNNAAVMVFVRPGRSYLSMANVNHINLVTVTPF